MQFGPYQDNDNKKSGDRLNRDQNNPADNGNNDRARRELDPSKREGRVENEDPEPVDETETPGGKTQPADANMNE